MKITAIVFLFLAASFFIPLHSGAESASANFSLHCAQCHGAGGRGDGINAQRFLPADPRDLTDGAYMGTLTDAEIISVIRDGGKPPAVTTVMPPYATTLTANEIVELKEFIRRLCDC